MENRTILDSQITASSEFSHITLARFARLYNQRIQRVNYGSWMFKFDDNEPWLQVDFIKYAKITAIDTQGNPYENRYTKTYKVYYGNSEENFLVYKEFDVQKVQYFQYDQLI